MAGLIPPDPRLKARADANRALESHTASFLQEPVAPPDAGPAVGFAWWLCAVSRTPARTSDPAGLRQYCARYGVYLFGLIELSSPFCALPTATQEAPLRYLESWRIYGGIRLSISSIPRVLSAILFPFSVQNPALSYTYD